MKLFKDDYSLIFKYYNIFEDPNNNLNVNLLNTKQNSHEMEAKQEPKSNDLYFTIDDIEKGKLII